MIDYEKFRLVIWDLDGTFWRGMLTDYDVVIDERNCRLVRDLADSGVISSVCSLNDEAPAKQLLEACNMWDLFVFPSIDWQPKGERIVRIIEKTGLDPRETLFLDDSPRNLYEAARACPGLLTADPGILDNMSFYFSRKEKTDAARTRLAQYKETEKRT